MCSYFKRALNALFKSVLSYKNEQKLNKMEEKTTIYLIGQNTELFLGIFFQ